MDVSGYWKNGKWVPGATLRTGRNRGASGLALEVAAACARCNEGRSEPLTELRELLQAHPVLKLEAREGEEHLLAPLVQLYATAVLQ